MKVNFIILVFIFCSCNKPGSPNEKEDPKEIAKEKNEEKFETRAKVKDAKFAVDAADISLEQIKLAKLTRERNTDTGINNLALIIETYHIAAFAKLKELAGQKDITIPSSTKKGEEAYTKLVALKGRNFEREYIDMLISEYKKTIDTFEKASFDIIDDDIRNWAALTTPIFRDHLERAKKCRDRLEKP